MARGENISIFESVILEAFKEKEGWPAQPQALTPVPISVIF
jgi:hypothetical protein